MMKVESTLNYYLNIFNREAVRNRYFLWQGLAWLKLGLLGLAWLEGLHGELRGRKLWDFTRAGTLGTSLILPGFLWVKKENRK
jgi:hypothetical protein